MAQLDAARQQALAALGVLATRHNELSIELAAIAAERDEAIRLAAEFGVSQRAIAERSGVTRPRVAQIVAAGKRTT